MKNKITVMMLACLAVLAMAVGCNQGPEVEAKAPAPEEPAAEALGKFEPGNPDDAMIRLYLTADGTMIWAEGKRGGNWDGHFPFEGMPESLGNQLTDIEVWEHDGTETDITKDDGTSGHVHSGGVSPPWGSHCHRWIRIGSHWIVVHC